MTEPRPTCYCKRVWMWGNGIREWGEENPLGKLCPE